MWQFENDKIWDSYSNRGVIKEKFDDQMTEEERQFIISDIYTYYKNGEPIEAIADLYEVEVEDVKDAISTMKKQLSDENYGNRELAKIHDVDGINTRPHIGVDPTKMSDTVDYRKDNGQQFLRKARGKDGREFDPNHGREVHGPLTSKDNNHVEPQKPRPKKKNYK